MSTVSIFGCSKGGLHRERYSKLPLTTRLSRVLWPVPISRRDIPISKRISGGSSKGKSITSSSSLKTRQSPVIKMSRHANSFPSRPVRLSTSFDQPKNILLNRHSNDTKSKSATLMLPSQKKYSVHVNRSRFRRPAYPKRNFTTILCLREAAKEQRKRFVLKVMLLRIPCPISHVF